MPDISRLEAFSPSATAVPDYPLLPLGWKYFLLPSRKKSEAYPPLTGSWIIIRRYGSKSFAPEFCFPTEEKVGKFYIFDISQMSCNFPREERLRDGEKANALTGR